MNFEGPQMSQMIMVVFEFVQNIWNILKSSKGTMQRLLN